MSGKGKHQSKSQVDKDLSSDQELANDQSTGDVIAALSSEIELLKQKNQQAEQAVARAQADYQNLRRRTDEEQRRIYQTASKMFIADLLEPLEQLDMAAGQINDSGLNMVLDKLAAVLAEHGLKTIDVLGKPFDVDVMECIEVEDGIEADEGVVTKELRKGYQLGDEVVQHAQVIVGKP